ncbi:ba7aa332-50b9-4cd7-8c70-0615f74a82bf [Sclerotinia trifoliorum]|uniref:Ba7aa332-50b9-4cd7-8c70-0615f74a82bf n=1 Tax=Sclerotinia trifoliorum TaxID=28548 RepID=A0A8H2ZQ87_9HELO|nr:ba7aa332-50b9-4cd7-8c70-0615f74a82bf [Sclerotinia trifoliorum]
MSYASQYIPEPKNIDLAWAEWELDFYAAAVSHATNWLANRSRLILEKFSSTESLANPAAVRLVSDTILLVAQSHRIKSPLAP